MDFNYDDIFGGVMDDLFITFYLSLIPDKKDRETTKKILTVFKKHGINPKTALDIMMDLSKVLDPGKVEVAEVSIDSQRMAYSILHNAYSQTKVTKDELIGYMCKARNVLNSKNKKEKAALVILNWALQKSKITKKELRDAIKEAAEELCK